MIHTSSAAAFLPIKTAPLQPSFLPPDITSAHPHHELLGPGSVHGLNSVKPYLAGVRGEERLKIWGEGLHMILHSWQGQKQTGLYPLSILCRRTEREKMDGTGNGFLSLEERLSWLQAGHGSGDGAEE